MRLFFCVFFLVADYLTTYYIDSESILIVAWLCSYTVEKGVVCYMPTRKDR
jgi:hypothetical protein